MSEDIAYDEDLSTSWDEVGDIATVRDIEFIRQSISTSIIENVDLSAPSLVSEDIEKQRGRIEEVVENNEFSQTPISVTLDDVDAEDSSIQYHVETRRISLPVTTV